MAGFAILLLYNFVGMMIEQYLHVPIPGSVIGLILFVASLFLKLVKLEWVEASGQFLIKNMLLFFVPVIVGSIAVFPLIKENLASVAISLIGSTFVVLAITGWVTHFLNRKAGSKIDS
jgi:holin-like protein